jgi:hypothetical protein
MGTQINQLSEVTSCSSGQQVPIYDPSNGDARKVSLSTLATWLQGILALGRAEADTQYSAPSATGFSVNILGSAGDKDVHLILTPAAGYAAGTLVLPPVAGLRDKQEVTVNCTQAITTLTVSGNGAAAVVGAPVTLTAGAFFKMCYDLVLSTWYRIG